MLREMLPSQGGALQSVGWDATVEELSSRIEYLLAEKDDMLEEMEVLRNKLYLANLSRVLIKNLVDTDY